MGTGSRSTGIGQKQEQRHMLPLRIGSGKGLLAGTCFTLIRRETLALGAALPCYDLTFCVEIVLMLL